ncbi:hypothetical protein EUX98_g7623 [Antrodiella citrinella]|uniref:Autophagy-related protein 2 n=1 Tax=Antrodiella citrinella TaxID=2447956 RepID=A0A4S4ML20_9APHY|nr:hypothetical protein EUX98_g7623 [Antrodiella citrinella]
MQAINALISGLPIHLYDGSIGKVTARIPWSNPLTSSVGLSLESLHLTFHLTPTVVTAPPTSFGSLAESVVSVADTFIQEELNAPEETLLRESLHTDMSASTQFGADNVPGGLDPFMSDTEESHGEVEPAGVSIFASLLERLLSRFHFDASDIRITLVHPGHASFTLTVPAIQYSTNLDPSGTGAQLSPPSANGPGEGIARTLVLSGIDITTRCLRPPSEASPMSPSSRNTTFTQRPSPALSPSTPISPSSDIDEDTQMLMSQSLAALPARPVSPSSSLEGSLYQSALSGSRQVPETIAEVPEVDETSQPEPTLPDVPVVSKAQSSPVHPKPFIHTNTQELQDETLFSLGSEPIVIRLVTPTSTSLNHPTSSVEETASIGREEAQSNRVDSSNRKLDALKMTITMGVIACCFKARHLRSLVDLAVVWASHTPSQPTALVVKDAPITSTPSILDSFEVTMKVQALVLVLSSNTSHFEDEAMKRYWSQPLVPPHLPYPYVRLHFDSLYAFMTVVDAIGDVSVFAISPSASSVTDLTASPILITDSNLAAQYTPDHVHPDLSDASADSCMPTFEVVDWTHASNRVNSTKLSQWRSKIGKGRTHHAIPEAAAVKVTLSTITPKVPSSRSKRGSFAMECTVIPLHVFVDVGSILEPRSGIASPAVQFIEELMAQDTLHDTDASPTEQYHDSSDEEEDSATPPGSPRVNNLFSKPSHDRERERERRRLEQLVLEDLNLDFDYRQDVPQRKASHPANPSRRRRRHKSVSTTKITINLSMVRVQIRATPPPLSPPRSGGLVIDIHGLLLNPGEPTQERKTSTRFVEAADMLASPPAVAESAGHVLMTGSLQRIVIAYCPVSSLSARALLSVGTLRADELVTPAEQGLGLDVEAPRLSSPVTPRITVSKSDPMPKRTPTSSNFVTTAVAIELPSVFLHLSKPQLDGLQLWADDLSQLVERAFSPLYDDDDATERRSSKDPSLIGSRFFTKSQRSRIGAVASSTVSTDPSGTTSETIVKVSVNKVALRVALPRHEDKSVGIRPFDVIATDVDLLLEIKPEGKDETVLTLGMMDASIFDHVSSGERRCYLALTLPRHMHPTTRPLLKLRFTSLIVPGTIAKETKVKVTFYGLTYNFYPDIAWISDLTSFVKAPPGAFETVVPSERTHISVKVVDISVRAFAPSYPGSIVLYLEETEFGTTIVGNSPQTSLRLAVNSLSLFLTDDIATLTNVGVSNERVPASGGAIWKKEGYALVTELAKLDLQFSRDVTLTPPDVKVYIDQGDLRLHLCADTATALSAFIADLSSAFATPVDEQAPPKKQERKEPTLLGAPASSRRGLMASLDERAFSRVPELISAPDMIQDDLPNNLDYLDESFSAAAGLRELTDDDLDEFGNDGADDREDPDGLVSKYGGETVRMLHPEGLRVVEHHFDTITPDADDGAPESTDLILKVRVRNFDATLFLYDGYDWARTRHIIEEERKNMRRRLAKIRQLVASGQTPDPSVEETNALLFNSVYIGLEHNIDELEPDALLAAIDDELNEEQETASQSSWQSFIPPPTSPRSPSSKVPKQTSTRHKVSKRSRGPSIEFRFIQLSADFDQYREDPSLASRALVTVRDVEILDHIKTSTWRKFLTALATDSKGNIRETGSDMVRVELRQVYPAPGHATQEARLRMKLLPIRLHVDQDALDFLKKFFSFKDPDALPAQLSDPSEDIYFQQAEVFPVDLKLDYKPRRVDYRALREGKTIELMNFFHFDGAEMTLRHITLTGITGWARVFDLLNDLWTPDVKATQLVEVISGVAPIRSVVNVGSGVADLVLLPIAQYRKDGRVVHGLQKGTKAFVKSTATEAIKLGARLATGTQVILEQAESVLGGQFKDPITAETMPPLTAAELEELDMDVDDLISRYADQPTNVQEGVQSAYKSLRRNLNSAAQTILAVPMEVYERSGSEGTVRAVVRAVPIAVLKPMIGASEAISKTLLGLHNTLDPGVRSENEAKYKQR